MIKILLEQLKTAAKDRPIGYSEDVISRGNIIGNVLVLEQNVYRELLRKYSRYQKPVFTSPKVHNVQHTPQVGLHFSTAGAGTELKKLIAKFGFKPKAGCKCNQHIQEMDLKGSDWCEQNLDTIVGWLREEAQRAGYPFTEIGAKLLIRRAIKNARKQVASTSQVK